MASQSVFLFDVAATPESWPVERQLWTIFRIAAAMCYIGHGAFGILTKAAWLPFFALVGIPEPAAYALMPLIGTVDILLGISVLVSPRRIVLLYMVVWSVWTAALRPLTGDSLFEMFERAGNYGVPLAMLWLSGLPASRHDWFAPARPASLQNADGKLLQRILAFTTALLLVGHGGLALIDRKTLLASHAAVLGLPAEAAAFGGALEILLGVLVLVRPGVGLLMAVAGWKLFTELLFPLSGDSWWEFIERGGSYAAPLALALLILRARSGIHKLPTAPAGSSVPTRALRIIWPWLLAGTLLAPGASLFAQSPNIPAGLADSLRKGGYVLLFRHTATDHSAPDGGSKRSGQRNLTSRGEDDARRIGEVVRSLRIPVGVVRANPMYRNRETAELIFGRMTVDPSLAGPGAGDVVRDELRRTRPHGTNTVLVTRIGILLRVFPRSLVGVIEEGDCIIVRPNPDGNYEIIAKLGVHDWQRLLSSR